ncbi:MAG: hypothetical protein R6V56_02475, partial [Lentisphaeria bacterium]
MTVNTDSSDNTVAYFYFADPGGFGDSVNIPDASRSGEVAVLLNDSGKYTYKEDPTCKDPNGWGSIGPYSAQLAYDPTDPICGYTAHWSGDLEPKEQGGGGEGAGVPSFTLDVGGEGSLSLKIKPSPVQPICISDSKTLQGELKERSGDPISQPVQWWVNGNGATTSSSFTVPDDFPSDLKPVEPGQYGITATFAFADNGGEVMATEAIKLVRVQSLTATDASDTDNDATTVYDGDTQTLYVPYTEDDRGNSTTSVNLSAVPNPGTWPDGKPVWTLIEHPEGSAPLPDSPGADFTYTATKPGTYKLKAECGNTLTLTISVLKMYAMRVEAENPTEGTVIYKLSGGVLPFAVFTAPGDIRVKQTEIQEGTFSFSFDQTKLVFGNYDILLETSIGNIKIVAQVNRQSHYEDEVAFGKVFDNNS